MSKVIQFPTIKENVSYQESIDEVVRERVQDCEPYVEAAKILRENYQGPYPTLGKELVQVAEFPQIIIEQYCKRKGITFSEFLLDDAHTQALLRDPDLAAFRVYQGKV